ncbi:hypothetical protein A3A75_04070 [Candidatus Woesebacteria bacterium RIFCSPLOWO2_01_FULL_39_10]|uniref:Uncharacterized protein n=1 Tax=Candidatus Woesebacteria bacterium RIFCSPLOWO2_01_FULL_39_10 TaxID=1802516 RepID=A0A1F8B9N7_9BACT|nr:MAG: hypothetical protein A3A75_04070 [Candidatus Woesebacteria bacterium RIFCSPLOWO2_01_FULL_39_10]
MTRELKFQEQVGPPIEVIPPGVAEELGKHYTRLAKMQRGRAYKKLGLDVDIRHVVKIFPDGKEEVTIFEDHY